MMSYEEVHGMTQEMIQLLESDNAELENFNKMETNLQKISKIREEQQKQIKRDIQALLDLKNEEESNVAIGQSDETFHNESERLSRQVNDTKQHKENVQKECDSVKDELQKMQTEQERLKQEKERVKEKTTEALPKIRYDVNLYTNISNIRWQYDCEAGEIKGYVCNKNDVKPFSLDSKEYSQYFITNYLWDLMEVDW